MARGRRSALVIHLSLEKCQTLHRWQPATTLAAGPVRRGRITLLLADGHSSSQVARLVHVQHAVVRKSARRLLAHRLRGLWMPLVAASRGGFPPRWPCAWYPWLVSD
jgi:hypothetical protein